MQKLIMLMSFGLILVTGCSKEGTSDQIEQEKTIEMDFVLKQSNGAFVWESMEADVTIDYPSATGTYNRGQSAHAHGDYPGVEFSGTQNNGGTHGSATLSLGPFTFTVDTECVMVEGNEAVYGGTITSRVGPPPPPGAPMNIGDYVYIKVFDNGQGSNADPDQFYGSIKFRADSKCGIYTPSNTDAWPPTIICCGGITINLINDVPEPGSIKVNN